MSKLLIAPALLLIITLGTYMNWAEQRPQRRYLAGRSASFLGQRSGHEARRRNLLAIRPELFPSDYQSPAHLYLKLADLPDKAKAEGLLYRNTVVALPDHIGTWLMLCGERAEVYRARDFREVVRQMALSHPGRLTAT